jgi:hypothetical protein
VDKLASALFLRSGYRLCRQSANRCGARITVGFLTLPFVFLCLPACFFCREDWRKVNFVTTPTAKLSPITIIICLAICACGLLASAYFLKGNPAQYSIDSGIFVVAVICIGGKFRRR